MELGERKRRILQAIVQDYIETAEPVGSRTIAKKHIPELSSATIRNEMADLEEMGYLCQPHTSAGRIPSDLGYRVYVDNMLNKYRFTLSEMEQMQFALSRKIHEAKQMATELSSVLSHLTNYTAVTASRSGERTGIRSLQLMPMEDGKILTIVVTNEGDVKNKMFYGEDGIGTAVIVRLSEMLSRRLTGRLADETIMELARLKGESSGILTEILDYIGECLTGESEVAVNGTINLLNHPEYSDINKAKEILEFINDKENLNPLVMTPMGDSEIKVFIGHENPLEQFKDCSVILCSYNLNGKKGSIGLVGPTRMDYSKVISMLEYLKKEIEHTDDGKE